MCLMDSPSAPPTPEPVAPPAPPASPADLQIQTKAKRRSEELSSKAMGTKRFRNNLSNPSAGSSSGLSGLNIPV
jgi:hypothetical protein